MEETGVLDLTRALADISVTFREKRDQALARVEMFMADASNPQIYPFRSQNLAKAEVARNEAATWETMRFHAVDGVLFVDRLPSADLRRIIGFDQLQAACFQAGRVRLAAGAGAPTRDQADGGALLDVNPDGQGRESSPPAVPKGQPSIMG